MLPKQGPKQDGTDNRASPKRLPDYRPQVPNGVSSEAPAVPVPSGAAPASAQKATPKSPHRPENGIKHKVPKREDCGLPVTLGELREELQKEFNRFGLEVLNKEIDVLGKRLETFVREQCQASALQAPAAPVDAQIPKLRRGWSRASSQRSASKDSAGVVGMVVGQVGGKGDKSAGRASQYSQTSGTSDDAAGRFKPRPFHVRPRMSTRTQTVSAEVYRQLEDGFTRGAAEDERPFVPTSSNCVELLDTPRGPSVRSLVQQADVDMDQTVALLEDHPVDREEPQRQCSRQTKSSVRKSTFLEEPPRTVCQILREAVQSEAFDHFVGCLILLNAVMTGFQAEFMARNWTLVVPEHFVLVDHIFCVLFTLEMILRMLAYGKTFWAYLGRNTLDCGIVAFQIFDEAVSCGAKYYQTHSESVLRMVRIFRLIRILRLARLLSLIGELRMLVVSILDSMRALIWTITLIWLIIYMFAVYFTQLVTEYKVTNAVEKGGEAGVLLELYGSLGRTMLCLYEAICAGRHWDSMLEPLLEFCNPWLSVVFVIYITICLVGVMNMVTSVFVTSAMQNVEEDRKAVLMQRMYAFFEQADEDQSGTISLEEFEEHIQDPQFQLYLKEIDLNPEHGRQLFNLLDDEATGDVAIEDIVSSCVRLHGPAKALDHANMMCELERLSAAIRKHQTYVDTCFKGIYSHLGVAAPEDGPIGDSGNAASEQDETDRRFPNTTVV